MFERRVTKTEEINLICEKFMSNVVNPALKVTEIC